MRKAGVILVLVFYCFTTDAQNWQQAGLGAGAVSKLYADTFNNVLYGLGGFNTGTADIIVGVAKYDGTKWDSVGQDFYLYWAMGMHNGELYVGGMLDSSSWNPRVYKWNGLSWDTVGGSFNNVIRDFITYNNELYMVGYYSSVGNDTISNIAKWNGTKWQSVDTSFNFYMAPINTAIEYNNELYVGGGFVTDSGRYIVKWDGSNWRSVGTEIEQPCGNNAIEDFAIYKGELYVAGCFRWKANENIRNNIAKWDGSKWLDVGGGTDKIINDLVVYQDILYAVGESDQAGGVPADEIALWNGVEWCGLGNTFYNGFLNAAEVFNNVLYVGGTFNNIDGTWIYGVAKWTGGSYTDTCGTLTGVNEFGVSGFQISVYPNPFSETATIEVKGINLPVSFSLYDQLGRQVKHFEVSGSKFQVDRGGLSDGIYFYLLEDKQANLIGRGKLLITTTP